MRTGIKSLWIFLFMAVMIFSCKKQQDDPARQVVAHHFLSDNKYDKLIIEIDYVEGYEPADTTISQVISFLKNIIHKPAGIEVVKNKIPASGLAAYTLTNISSLEYDHRGDKTKESTLTAYVLFLEKDYNNGSSTGNILGIQYGSSSIAIFENTIRRYSGGLAQPSVELLETTVLEHEFGHMLGLTNNGSAMSIPHQDVANGAHCNNKECLMYYQAETSDVVANLLKQNQVPLLDNHCRADLKGNGAK